MRFYFFIVSWLMILPVSLLANEPDVTIIKDSIIKLAGKDWTVVKEDGNLTLIRQKVRHLYLISLPDGQSDDLFKEFGLTSDYRITISYVPKLSDKEYNW